MGFEKGIESVHRRNIDGVPKGDSERDVESVYMYRGDVESVYMYRGDVESVYMYRGDVESVHRRD